MTAATVALALLGTWAQRAAFEAGDRGADRRSLPRADSARIGKSRLWGGDPRLDELQTVFLEESGPRARCLGVSDASSLLPGKWAVRCWTGAIFCLEFAPPGTRNLAGKFTLTDRTALADAADDLGWAAVGCEGQRAATAAPRGLR